MKPLIQFALGCTLLLTIAATLNAAQTGTPQTAQRPGSGTQPQQGPPSAAPPTGMQERMQQMRKEQEAEMQQVKAELDEMRGKVNKMRADGAKINDQAAKSAMSTNADIWQSWIDSMQRRLDRMKAMLDQQIPPKTGEQSQPR
jgi:phage terminase small subunit